MPVNGIQMRDKGLAAFYTRHITPREVLLMHYLCDLHRFPR